MIKQDGKMFRVFDASGRDTGKYGMSMEKALQIEAKLGIKSGGAAPTPRAPAPPPRPAPARTPVPVFTPKKPSRAEQSSGVERGDPRYRGDSGLYFFPEDRHSMPVGLDHRPFDPPPYRRTKASDIAAKRLTWSRSAAWAAPAAPAVRAPEPRRSTTSSYVPSASVETAYENARVSAGTAKAETTPAEQLRRYTEANKHIRTVSRLLLEDFLSSLDALPADQQKLENKAQDGNKKTAFNASFFELKKRIENLAEFLDD